MGGDSAWWLDSLHAAARYGSTQEVARLAAEARDVDAFDEGHSALWAAVHERRFDNVEALLAAGADPARPMMFGWSPARLSLTTTHPLPTDESLTPAERAAIVERVRLVEALSGLPHGDGFSVACVAGVDAQEAVGRLRAVAVAPSEDQVETWWDYPEDDESAGPIGVTAVPGGCVLLQTWGFDLATEGVLGPLSIGTVAYGMYANPKSGNQGSIHRDDTTVAWDLHPGGGVDDAADSVDVLLAQLYLGEPMAYCCAYTGLRLENARPFIAPDSWVRLPEAGRGLE